MFSDNVIVSEKRGSIRLSRLYAVIDKIGEGGMGEVYKVCYKQMEEVRWAAMKILDKKKFHDERELEISLSRFHREVKLLSRVRHPNIIGFLDCFEDAERAYLVMDYAEGVTMDKWVQQFSDVAPVEQLVDILLNILDVLVYMKDIHGMHHRDIKPGNIMVNVLSDGKINATLIDFGNTKIPDEEDNNAKGLTMMSGVMAGTIGYLPPVVYAGIYTEEDDVFALAATLLFALLKYEPFVAEDRAKSNEKIAEKDYDLGVWSGTFLAHWIEQNVHVDRRKRMTLKQAQRSLQRFRENSNYSEKCSEEKVKLYSSNTALFSMINDQVHNPNVKQTNTDQLNLTDQNKTRVTSLSTIKINSKLNMLIIFFLLILSLVGISMFYLIWTNV